MKSDSEILKYGLKFFPVLCELIRKDSKHKFEFFARKEALNNEQNSSFLIGVTKPQERLHIQIFQLKAVKYDCIVYCVLAQAKV